MIYAAYALMMENKLLLIQYVGIRYVLNALIIYIKEIINYVVQFVDSAIGIIKYQIKYYKNAGIKYKTIKT